jgi:hypothetical protein
VQLGEQEKLFRIFLSGIAAPVVVWKQGRGHNQESGRHQSRQKERVKIEGKTEFFVIIGSDHRVYKQIKIVAGLDKNMSRPRISWIQRFHRQNSRIKNEVSPL